MVQTYFQSFHFFHLTAAKLSNSLPNNMRTSRFNKFQKKELKSYFVIFFSKTLALHTATLKFEDK